MLYSSFLFAALLFLVEASSEYFHIRHKMSGGVLCDDNYVRIYNDDTPSYCQWYFESVDGEWGYITNGWSGDHITPDSYSMSPSDGTYLRLWSGHHPYQRFALDQVNNRIIHYGGKYIHVEGDAAEPERGAYAVLFGNVNAMMEFELTKPGNPDEIVYPYGDATISGDWVLVFSVENALATHEYTVEAMIGKSETDSITSSFQFVWEGSAGAQFWFAQMSTSASLSNQIEQSSAQTWTVEVKVTNKITVAAGASVATWQKHFYGEQLGHKAVHQSNIFQDTEGPGIKPGDDLNDGYYFI